jgi:hypothetical protein
MAIGVDVLSIIGQGAVIVNKIKAYRVYRRLVDIIYDKGNLWTRDRI